eukprot:s1340_g8.t1
MAPKRSEKGQETHCRNRINAVVKDVREQLGSEGLVRCLARTLSEDEFSKLKEIQDDDAHIRAFAVEVATRSQSSSAAQEIVAGAAQSTLGSRSKAKALQVPVPGMRLWSRVRRGKAKQKPGRKTKVHSPSIRDKVQVFLLENATATARLYKFGNKVVPVYNLKTSRGRLWARSAEMQQLLSRSTWYLHLKTYHPNFVRLKCRTDVCTFCHKYDKVLLPALRRDLDKGRGQIIAVHTPYFNSMDEHWASMEAAQRTDPDGQLSLQYVKFMKLFIDKTAADRLRVPSQPGTVTWRQQLKEAEAAASDTLKKYVGILESCVHHFSTVRRQHQTREQQENHLPEKSLLIQLDFMENMTWPLGPEEAQDWFWATARESMTTLGNDLISSLPVDDVDHMHCWADCGAHFRSYEFLWNLVEQCRDRFPHVTLHFFAEHHGKGRCDGAFGLQRRWVADYARTTTIDSLQGMKSALETGAEMTMSLDPPPQGPAYKVKIFEPKKKDSVKKFDVSGTDLQIEYTYCLSLERATQGHVRVRNFCFSDRLQNQNSGSMVGKASCTTQKCTEEWRRSYRQQVPEKTPLNTALLQRRLERQKMFSNLPMVSRRDSVLTALRRKEKRAAVARVKYQRQKRVLAVNLQEADSSSGEDTSSESSG